MSIENVSPAQNVGGSRKIAPWVIAGVCLFHILAVMGYLLRDGRLSIVPIYDDVFYMIDGLGRLAVLDRSGIGGFLADFYTHPAHSPLSAIASTFGFLLSGGAIWGPYAVNAVWVLIIAALALITVRRLDFWSKIGIVVAILATPIFGSVVAEFRPDPVWGLLVGFSLAIMASTDIIQTSPRRLLALGLLFGLAVIAKPSASPGTVVVLGVGFSVQLGLSIFARSNWTAKSVARSVSFVMTGSLVLVIPYFITNGAGVLSYILTVMGTDNSVWRTNASVMGHITFYVNRDVGTLMLGWLWYLAIPIVIVCGGILIRAKDKLALCSFAGMVSSLLVAYMIVTASSMKTLMIGSIFYGIIIAIAAWALGQIVSHTPIRREIIGVLGVAIFLTQWVPRAGMIQRTDPAMVMTDKANKAALPEVLEALRAGEAKTALVTVPGPVYAGTLDFLVRQQGIARKFNAAYTWNTWEMFTQGVSAADVIILSEAGMAGQALGFNFPSVQFQERLLGALRANPEFSAKMVFTDEKGKSVWLFVRR